MFACGGHFVSLRFSWAVRRNPENGDFGRVLWKKTKAFPLKTDQGAKREVVSKLHRNCGQIMNSPIDNRGTYLYNFSTSKFQETGFLPPRNA